MADENETPQTTAELLADMAEGIGMVAKMGRAAEEEDDTARAAVLAGAGLIATVMFLGVHVAINELRDVRREIVELRSAVQNRR